MAYKEYKSNVSDGLSISVFIEESYVGTAAQNYSTIKWYATWSASTSVSSPYSVSYTIDVGEDTAQSGTFTRTAAMGGGTLVVGRTYAEPHRANGTGTIAISISARNGAISLSASPWMTSIARDARLSGRPDRLVLGENASMGISYNLSGTYVRCTYKVSDAAGEVEFYTGNGSSCTLNVPTSMGQYITAGMSVTGYVYIRTYSRDTYTSAYLIDSNYYGVTFVVPSYSYSPTVTVGHADSHTNVWIKGVSIPTLKVTGLTAHYGVTPVASYRITQTGESGTLGNNVLKTLEKIAAAGSYIITITFIDSRGVTATTFTRTLTVSDYNNPQITAIRAYRTNGSGRALASGSYFVVEYSGNVYNTGITNAGTWTVKVDSTNVETVSGVLINRTTADFDAPSQASHTITVTVQDSYGDPVSRSVVLPPAVIALTAGGGTNGSGVAIGGVSTKDAFEVFLDTIFQAMPAIGSVPLLEYGSGANSTSSGSAGVERWYKFYGGLLIKVGYITRTTGMATWSSPIRYTEDATINFNSAVPFVSAQDLHVDLSTNISSTVWGSAHGISTTGFSYNFMRAGTLSSTNWIIKYKAIGRWQ